MHFPMPKAPCLYQMRIVRFKYKEFLGGAAETIPKERMIVNEGDVDFSKKRP